MRYQSRSICSLLKIALWLDLYNIHDNNHDASEYANNAANTHVQGSGRAHLSQNVTLSSKAIRL